MPSTPTMLRIIDANLNRISEGLRVLEEVARFLLDDALLTKELKGLRHQLIAGYCPLYSQLLAARRSGEDVGSVTEEGRRENIAALISANARRVQESLRVLEEFAKLPSQGSVIDAARLKEARFALYELERRLVSRALRRDKVQGISGLYLILDLAALRGRKEIEVARSVIRGGAKVIQLRAKLHDKGRLLSVAREIKSACAEAGVLFIMNDDVDLTYACRADGVHLGQGDLPIVEARKILPLDAIVGCSTATLAEAIQAQANGADYIAVGSIYPTSSKAGTRLAGLETLRQVKKAVALPVVAIGGINEAKVAEVITAGADCIAVISAVLDAEDVEAATRQLVAKIEQCRESK